MSSITQTTIKKRRKLTKAPLALALALSALIATGGIFATPAPTSYAAPEAADYMVNTVEDSTDGACTPLYAGGGDCTLREAIALANSAAGAQTIHFSIGTGPATITLVGALPQITGPLTIDGTTQPGYGGRPIIELNGQNAGGSTAGLHISGGNSIVKGLVINRFGTQAIHITGSGGNRIEGNFLGTDITGNVDLGNGQQGVRITDSPNNTIGGTVPAARNIISGNGLDGIYVDGGAASGNQIQGNYIGTNISGTVALGNSQNGIGLGNTISNTVGGPGGARNILSGNDNGVAIYAYYVGRFTYGNKVQNNYIGTDPSGVNKVGSQQYGIVFQHTDSNLVGGGVGLGNVIAYNEWSGIIMYGDASYSNAILSNSIFGNENLPGIDMNYDRVTPNDPLDSDGGPNKLQNYPTLATASTSSVTGSLDSGQNKSYTIEFFANDSCHSSGHGSGQTFLGSTVVNTGVSGSTNFIFNMSAPVAQGKYITATATDNATNDTSEFSACVRIPLPPTATATSTSTNTATSTSTNTATSTSTSTSTSTTTRTATSTSTSIPTHTATSIPSHTATSVVTTVATATATATSTTGGCNVQFTDMDANHPFYSYALCLTCKGVVSGYPDGTFRPNAQVTRGQLSKMVANAAGYDETVSGQTFSDVAPDSPFYPFIERLAKRNIIGGYADGTFRPNNNVTRGQLAKIVSGAIGGAGNPGQQRFEDVPPGSPFYEWVQHLTGHSIMSGYPCGAPGEPCGEGNLSYFRPGNNATRGQTAKIVAGAFFPNCDTVAP